MKSREFLRWIVLPVLDRLAEVIPQLNSQVAINLLLGTWAQESEGGIWIDQTAPGPGPAFGPFQMEEATFRTVTNWIQRPGNPILPAVADFMLPGAPRVEHLHGNFYAAVAYCRLGYWIFPEPLPDARDLRGIAAYWKKYWNTPAGAGTVGQFINRYHLYIE